MSTTGHEMRFGIFLPPASWEDSLRWWRMIDELGFDCAGVTDHFMPTSGSGPELEKPFPEAWTVLSALATHSERLRVAVLVSGNTYRNPALLAKQAATLDHITGGRVDLGIGAGWYEAEHQAFGWPFPSAGERVDMLGEAVQIIRSLFTKKRTTFIGEHYQLHDAPLEPKPVQSPLPLMIGGRQPRMMRLIAEHADIWSIDFGPDEMARSGQILEEHCVRIGRDQAEIRRSAFVVPRRVGRNPWASLDDFLGVVDAFRQVGASEIYLRMPDEERFDVLEQTAGRLPDLRG